MFSSIDVIIEFAKAMPAIVVLGAIWLLVQSAYRRQKCRMEGGLDDGELSTCSGCHPGNCQRASE